MSNTKADIALRMRRLRKACGEITQADMAERLDGVNRATLANIESGRQWPSRNVMEALTERFNVNAEWLLLGEGPIFRADVEAWGEWIRKVQDAEIFSNLTDEFRAQFADSLKEVRQPDPSEMPPEPTSAIDHVEAVWSRFEESKKTSEAPVLQEPQAPKKTVDEATRLALAKVRVAGVLEDYPDIKGIRTVEVAMWNIAALEGASLEHLYLLANAFNVLVLPTSSRPVNRHDIEQLVATEINRQKKKLSPAQFRKIADAAFEAASSSGIENDKKMIRSLIDAA